MLPGRVRGNEVPDRFGLNQMLPMEQRVSVVARLCERGYADRMVLSHDAIVGERVAMLANP